MDEQEKRLAHLIEAVEIAAKAEEKWSARCDQAEKRVEEVRDKLSPAVKNEYVTMHTSYLTEYQAEKHLPANGLDATEKKGN